MMKALFLVFLLIALVAILSSCVSVTTERSAEYEGYTPDGGQVRHARVETRSYGLDALELVFDIIIFPFKALYYAVKLLV